MPVKIKPVHVLATVMRSRAWFSVICGLTLVVTLLFAACQSPPVTSSAPDPLAQEHAGDRPVATELATQAPRQAVTAQPVTYATVADQAMTGWLAQPTDGPPPTAGIIAIHEWWGLNENIKATAERLAGEGYAVLAVDLYGGVVTDNPDQARQQVQQVRQQPATAQANLQQAYQYLVNELGAEQVGTIGWCFGGAWSLQTAILLPQDIDATVIYYGQLVTDADTLQPLTMPILGIFGAADTSIPLDTVRSFEATLQDLGKTVQIEVYPDAGHAFANPSGQRYQPEAAAAAWQSTLTFFQTYLATSS